MIQREKRYVEVDVRFSTEGRLRPLQIIFDKGQVYKIDKIKDICRRAADVGGVGDRYTCMIQGKERELWFEDGRWFVAAKVAIYPATAGKWTPSAMPGIAARTFQHRRAHPSSPPTAAWCWSAAGTTATAIRYCWITARVFQRGTPT